MLQAPGAMMLDVAPGPDRGGLLGVVVVNFGTSELLDAHLAPLQGRPGCRIVIVDNFSTRLERDRVRALCASRAWRLVEAETNLGFGAGVNLGAKQAISDGAELLLVINPDATIDEPSLDLLVQECERHPRSIVGPRILRPTGSVWSQGMRVDLQDGTMRRGVTSEPTESSLPWLTGACFLVDSGLWSELGGFDERYFLYWEDVDLSVRASRAGVELRVVDGATAVHMVGASQTRRSRAKSPTYYYYNVRNRLLFAAANLDAASVRRWMATGRAADWEILRRGGRRQLLTSMRPLLAVLRGRREGRALAARALSLTQRPRRTDSRAEPTGPAA